MTPPRRSHEPGRTAPSCPAVAVASGWETRPALGGAGAGAGAGDGEEEEKDDDDVACGAAQEEFIGRGTRAQGDGRLGGLVLTKQSQYAECGTARNALQGFVSVFDGLGLFCSSAAKANVQA